MHVSGDLVMAVGQMPGVYVEELDFAADFQ